MYLPSPPMANNNTANNNNSESSITKPTDEPVKRKVGRPGRKRIDTEAKNKRTQQNRAAQRAYRERKENKLKNLENKIHWLEKLNLQNVKESAYVMNGVERLINELNKYRPSNDEDNQLLDFLNQSGQIKSGIKNELTKIEKKNEPTPTPTTKPASPTQQPNDKNETNNNPSPVTSFSSTSPTVQSNNNNNSQQLLNIPDNILNNNNILDTNVWSGLLLKKGDNTNTISDFNNTWDSNGSAPISTRSINNNNNNNNTQNTQNTQNTNVWSSIPLPQDPTTVTTNNNNTNFFDFNNTYELNNNMLNNLAFPDIWGDPTNNINSVNSLDSPVVSTTTTIPNMDLPFDCTCGGACFTSPSTDNNTSKKCDSDCESDSDEEGSCNPIKCDILTRHLLNHESIQSVLNDRQFLDNEASHCSHFINNVKLQNQLKSYDNKSFESVVENLCNELMVKCQHDPMQNNIILNKKDLRKAMLNI